jgi:hypothetical protein
MFVWGPPQPSFERGIAISLEDASELSDGRTARDFAINQEKNEHWYKLMSRIGLGLVSTGFALQFLAVAAEAN